MVTPIHVAHDFVAHIVCMCFSYITFKLIHICIIYIEWRKQQDFNFMIKKKNKTSRYGKVLRFIFSLNFMSISFVVIIKNLAVILL
jgi:hypothetical protein